MLWKPSSKLSYNGRQNIFGQSQSNAEINHSNAVLNKTFGAFTLRAMPPSTGGLLYCSDTRGIGGAEVDFAIIRN